jgi:hypothetical protein
MAPPRLSAVLAPEVSAARTPADSARSPAVDHPDEGEPDLVVAPYTTRSWQYSFYVRDQWQISPKITLSIGTRWEYFPIPTRADRASSDTT